MIRGWNAIQTYEFTADWGKRFLYVCDQAKAQGITHLRIDPRVKFTGGPSVFNATERAMYEWMAQVMVERNLIPLITLISFVPAANANWGNAGASQSWKNASGTPIDNTFWPGLVTQFRLFLECFRDAYRNAGGIWENVYVQLENEPGNQTTFVIDATFNDWMDYAIPLLADLMPTIASASFWGGTTAQVNAQMGSLSGDWLDLIDVPCANLYTSAAVTFPGNWAQANVREIRTRGDLVRTKFGGKDIFVTENAPDTVTVGNRPLYFRTGARTLDNRRRMPCRGVFNYIFCTNTDNNFTPHGWVDANDAGVFASLPTPTIPGVS